jgi:hypothetical protein
MASVPTSEESAKLILEIFKRHNVKAGQILMAGALNIEFLKGGSTAAEYEGGMKFALEKKWIEIEPNMIRLTQDGFDAM